MTRCFFGVSCGSEGSPQEIFSLAEQIEALGYDSLWVGDHISFHTPMLDSLTLLSMFAARTKQITVGTAVYLLPLRHPTVVAKITASLDYLSSGRLIFGVGVGGENPKEFEACGIPVHERGRRTDEGIEIVQKLWTESNVTYKGRYFQLTDVTLEPKPAQKPHPPIWVGGRSDAALRRAARVGAGWISYVVTPERFAQSMEKIKNFAAEAGRVLPADFAAAHLVFITIDQRREVAHRIAAEILSKRYNQPFEKLVEKYCVFGTPQQCLEQLQAFAAAGVHHFLLNPICAPAQRREHLEICAEEIISQLRGGKNR
jgi:probable F420-dependent oxidoreductase